MGRNIIAAFGVAVSLSAASAYAGDISVAEAGARHGQALSAAKICPGGKITAKGEALPGSYSGDDTAVFKAESEKVTAAWDKAFQCEEVDPATHHSTTCRRMKLISCRQAWIEIGPEGRNIPGLLDVDFSAWAEKHPEAP